MRSFRTRIFVVTALTVMLVLAGAGWLAGTRFERDERSRLDQRLCDEAQRLAGPLPVDAMAQLEPDIAAKLHVPIEALLIASEAAGGADAQRSARWPATLAPDRLAWARADAAAPPERPACALASFDQDGADWRAGRVGTPQGVGIVAADLAPLRADMRGRLRSVALATVPWSLLLAAVGAWVLSGLALKPVLRLQAAMRAVDEKALDQRLPGDDEDREFQPLVDAYNQMLTRLEASFHQASRFSADAAHELKTPLTVLQGRLEQALQACDGRAVQRDLADMLDEVARLASITRKLLLLSQADAGSLALQRSPVDLSAMLAERVAEAQALERPIAMRTEIAPGLTVNADAHLLGQLLDNLASNALKYTPAGGWIEWRARPVPGAVELLLSNSTPPLGASQRARFFERFFRADAAHSRRVDGQGLGLSLARVIARAHGGELSLAPSADDVVVLRLRLPTAAR